jgi:GH25 family lysozyme M1 (1,4-beta-N-acetylmuramidase)
MFKGIDISAWQGDIDYDKLNVDFVIIRAGHGQKTIDKKFKRNIEECNKRGIPCGVYWYSYADSPEDAIREAEACYEVIKGYKFQYPVYYAVEDQCFSSKSSKEISDIISAFCSTLEKKKYYVGVKSYANFLNTKLDSSIFEKYDIWVAHYGVSKPAFNRNYNMWQYTTEEKIDGITGYVNCDYAYLNFPKTMKDFHLNGF